jgi:hypothetical protein
MGNDRYAYANNNPLRYTDPTGHSVACGLGKEGCEGGTDEQFTESDILGVNGWDYVPIVSDVRHIIRGTQTVYWASQQPGFMNEQLELQAWYNNCYGVCYGLNPISGSPFGGPMPNVPLVDVYSEGAGEAVGSGVNLSISVSVIRSLPEPKINTPRFGLRIAPFGNAGEGPLASQLPHIHFRIGPQLGKSYAGFGWRWHHPWDDICDLSTYLRMFKETTMKPPIIIAEGGMFLYIQVQA